MNALRLQPHNAPIKRDLSWLQVQMGHHAGTCVVALCVPSVCPLTAFSPPLLPFAGFKETRRQILTDKPSAKANWVSFAAACYVNGDYTQASEVVQDLFKTMTNPDASTKYEDR